MLCVSVHVAAGLRGGGGGKWKGKVLDKCTGSHSDMFHVITLKKVMQDRQISLTVRVLHLSALF